MSDQPRPLPGQPSLRYLKLEARHRLAACELAPSTTRSSPSPASTASRAGRRLRGSSTAGARRSDIPRSRSYGG